MVEDRGPVLRAVVLVFVSMAFVATSLRIYVRAFLVKAFGWDDTWMVFAMLAHIGFATCSTAGTVYGTGRHFKDLTQEGIIKAMRYWWLCYIAYCLTMITVKISVGLFLLRITVVKLHRWIIYIAMSLTVLTGIVFFFVTLFQCSPVSYFWNRIIPTSKGKCINVDVIIGLTYFYSGISALCDFTLGLLPVWLVWNLNMSRNAKIMLVPILSMACIASAAVIVRMGYVLQFKTNDFLYDTVDIAIWSDIEQGLAVTAGSLATLRPLYRIVARRVGLSNSASAQLKPSHPDTPLASPFQNSRSRRSGPFSLTTFAKGDGKSEEEYGLENCKPIQLRDDLVASPPKPEKSFMNWKVQGGDGSDSGEELNKKPSAGAGRITKQTDVYLRSDAHSHQTKSRGSSMSDY